MSAFFSPLEEDDVRRTRQDEDEERLAEKALDAVGDRARVFPLWNAETRFAIENDRLRPTTLLVATTPWSCDLVFDTVDAGALKLRPLGAITVAGVSARGIEVSGQIKRNDPVGTLWALADDANEDQDEGKVHDPETIVESVMIFTVRHDVPAELAREYAKCLLENVKAERVVAVAAIDEAIAESGSRSASDAGGIARALALDIAGRQPFDWERRDGKGLANARTPQFPTGVLLDGLAAAIAARREMTGAPARIIAVPIPAGGRGSAGASRGAGSGRGPGFGGGVGASVAAHAAQLVFEATGINAPRGLEHRRVVGYGNVVGGDTDRLFS